MTTFDKLVAKAKFDNKYISPNFKYVPSKLEGEVELVYPNKVMTTRELWDTYEFASIEQILQYAIDNPDEQRKYPIVTIWKQDDVFWCACLSSGGSYRELDVNRVHAVGQWNDNFRFLRRKSLGTGTLGASWPLETLIINGVKYIKA